MKRWVSLLVALLALAGCTTTEADEDTRDPTTSVSSDAADIDADESSTTTTTGPPADCPPPGAGGLPTDGQELSEALGDFDGNGSIDQLFVYASRSGRRPWRLRVVLSSGYGTDLELEEPTSRGQPARAVGGFALGEGGDVALAVVGSGASALRVGLFAFRDCEVVPIRGADGEHAVFPVGGSVGEGHGLECGEGTLAALTARTRDGRTYTTERITYRRNGTSLTQVSTGPGPTLDNRTAKPLVDLHYTLACGTLGVGPGGRRR